MDTTRRGFLLSGLLSPLTLSVGGGFSWVLPEEPARYVLKVQDGVLPFLTVSGRCSSRFPNGFVSYPDIPETDSSDAAFFAEKTSKVLVPIFEIASNPRITLYNIKRLSKEEAVHEMAELAFSGLEKLAEALGEHQDAVVEKYTTEVGVPPRALVTLVRTMPTILSADDPVGRSLGYSIFTNVGIVALGEIPKECLEIEEAHSIQIDRKEIDLTNQDIRTANGRARLAQEVMRSVQFS